MDTSDDHGRALEADNHRRLPSFAEGLRPFLEDWLPRHLIGVLHGSVHKPRCENCTGEEAKVTGQLCTSS